MLAWMITRVQVLGLLAAGLLGLSVLSWIAPNLLPRSRRRSRIPVADDDSNEEAANVAHELRELKRSVSTLPEAKRIAELPESDVYPYLRHGKTPLRLAAAERLRTVATPENADRLVERLHGEQHETDEAVRLKLALVLAKLRRSEALPVLAAALTPDRPGRAEALASLVDLGARQYVPEVLALAEAEREAVGTANAVHTVMRLGGGEELLERRWRRVLRRYVDGLQRLLPVGAEDARNVVELLRSSSDQEHRQLAFELDQMLSAR
jgi:hypothetical protein